MTTEQVDRVALVHIRRDGGTQARAGLNEETVEEYIHAIKNRADFPPIIVYFDGTDTWLADGFHRVEAFKRTARLSIPADIRQGTRRDAILHAVGANAQHGLRRTNADKRRAVETLLRDEEWSKWSDREIARLCAVSQPLVSQMRSSLTDNIISERTYTTKHGTTATMDTSKVGKKQPPEPPEPEPEEEEPAAAAEEPAAPHPSLPPGWYFQDSSNPADIIAINRENASQASGFCQTHEEAAARAWEVHRKQERPEAKKPEPKKASAPAPEPAPAPVPDELIELLRTVNPDAGPHSFGSRIAADGKTQYRVSVPTGSGGSISTDWHRADYLRQWMEGHIEKLQGHIRDNVNAMQKIGFRLSGDVVWQRVDQHRLMPFYPLASNAVNPELWSETQVQSVLVFHVRMNDRLRKEQDEVSKVRKELARLDVRRHELEQQVKQLTARLEEGAGSI